MKKTKFFVISALVLALSIFVGCSKSRGEDNYSSNDISSQTSESSSVENDGSAADEPKEQSKILVAYFSATGNTKAVAEKIAEVLSRDLYEIRPREPYTDRDLNYNDKQSRVSHENNDDSARPDIAGEVDLSGYDTVLVGYPIWWSKAPKIINTFLESRDFNGKTVAPFCTSASSPLGTSADNLKSFASGAEWLAGERFSRSADDDAVKTWLTDIGLYTE